MATILDLRNEGALIKLDPVLEAPAQEFREIDLFPEFAVWARDVLPNLDSTWDIETRPLAQFDDLVSLFCSGDPLVYEWQFHPIQHVHDGVWMLKTADLRLFGWFPKKDHFIALSGHSAQHVKDY